MKEKKNSEENFLLYHELYTLYINIYPCLSRFPKSEKFTLRQSIDTTAIEMLITIDRFTRLNQKDKSSQLRKISYLFDKFKLLLKISKDLHFLPFNQYILLMEKEEKIGKLIGGLLKKYNSNL